MKIDVQKLKIPFNWVLIKLDNDHNTYHSVEQGTDTGISVAPWGVNQASHLALTGIVVSLPVGNESDDPSKYRYPLVYNGYETAALKRDGLRTDADQKRIAQLRNESMAYHVPMEIEVGHRVYFEYRTRLDAIEQGRVIEDGDDKHLLIPYDQLIMVFNPETDFNDVKVTDVYMLNGFVLIKPLEYETERGSDGIVSFKTENDIFMPVNEKSRYVRRNNLWYASVLTAGCIVQSYADFPGRGDDRQALNPGMKICYDGRHQKRLEVEHHRVIFKNHKLYRIQRKDITAVFPTGIIN